MISGFLKKIFILFLSFFIISLNIAYGASYKGKVDCNPLNPKFQDYGDSGRNLCEGAVIGLGVLLAAVANPISSTSAAAILALTLTALGVTADNNAQSVNFCDLEAWPLPMTDSAIRNQLLSTSVSTPTVEDIVDKYDKICVESGGQKAWIQRDTCAYVNGLLTCAVPSEWSDSFICMELVNTCPCVVNMQYGSLLDPEFETESNGVMKVDDKGNPKIINQKEYDTYFAKHCTLLRSDDLGDLMPFAYNGIIDELCNTWVGYSKLSLTLTGGPIQCLQNTLQNIFDKPIEFTSTKTSHFSPNAAQKTEIENYDADLDYVNIVKKDVISMLTDSIEPKNNSLLSSVMVKVDNIIARTVFLSKQSDRYNIVDLESMPDFTSLNLGEQKNVLNKTRDQLTTVIESVSYYKQVYLTKLQQDNSNDNKITTFQNLQAFTKSISLVLIVLYITIIGIQILVGSFNISFKSIFGIVVQLMFITYFALGDGWRDYFYRMIFDASIGFSEIFFSAADTSSVGDSYCTFSKPYYVPTNAADKCNFPNAYLGGSVEQFVVSYNPKNGNPIKGCLKGPFIPRPNYEAIYRPVVYEVPDPVSGLLLEKVLNVYCKKDDLTTVKATLNMNPITNEPMDWSCPVDADLEEGYRFTELAAMGINDLTGIIDPAGATVFYTALRTYDRDGQEYDIYDLSVIGTSGLKEKLLRVKRVTAMENRRAAINQRSRDYPLINRFGKKRDMRYVGLFDTLDCKVLRYFQYNLINNSFDLFARLDPLAILFTGTLGLILFIQLILFLCFIIGLMGHIVQSYMVSLFAITVLTYMSPIIMPLTLFSMTKSIGQDWVQKIIGYASYPPLLFMTVSMGFTIIDYAVFGSSATFVSQKMFDSEGNIDGLACWDKDRFSAPMACLFAKLPYHVIKFRFLGIPLTSFSSDALINILPALILGFLKALIIIVMVTDVVKKIQEAFASMMGVSADVSLEGSIFNSSDGVLSLAKKAAKEMASSLKQMAASSAGGAARSAGGAARSAGGAASSAGGAARSAGGAARSAGGAARSAGGAARSAGGAASVFSKAGRAARAKVGSAKK